MNNTMYEDYVSDSQIKSWSLWLMTALYLLTSVDAFRTYLKVAGGLSSMSKIALALVVTSIPVLWFRVWREDRRMRRIAGQGSAALSAEVQALLGEAAASRFAVSILLCIVVGILLRFVRG